VAEAENQPIIGDGAPLFEWTPGVAIQDEEPVCLRFYHDTDGKIAIDALFEEFLPLHDLGIFVGQHRDKLTKG
jgi:hypothetical protein